MKWPLFIVEPSVADLARRYYPELEIVETDLWKMVLPRNLVACDPYPLLQQVFSPEQLSGRRFFWLPHGNSDKDSFTEGMFQTEIPLVYGNQMIERLKKKGIEAPYIRIGNFRLSYYREHQRFYEGLLSQYKNGRNILYAPTWDDREKGNSFWTAFPTLAEQINDRLLVKIHPNTPAKYLAELTTLEARYAKRKNIVFLEEFPPIYPLLEISAIYIGDTSSIGYDFLSFNRPMLFLNSDDRPLNRCGKTVAPHEISSYLEQPGVAHEKFYYEAFDRVDDWEPIRKTIEAMLL